MLPTCLVVALPAEARPLISYFGMRGLNHPYLRLYQGSHGYLLQTGIGKLNAASATATLLASMPDVSAIVNIGIAGSEFPIGETLVAHGIQDKSSEQQWFPHLPSAKKLNNVNSTKVVTVDRPACDYSNEHVFDMEAAGIFNSAAKVLDLAFIHSIKVVSDNSGSSIENINAKSVTENIGSAIPVIEKLLQSLPFDTLPSSDAINHLSALLTKQLHYTATETHALDQLLHRYNALTGDIPKEQDLLTLNSAKKVRQKLTTDIKNASISY